MIKLLGKLPSEITISCSGGPDSMAAVDFLMRSKRSISLIHFDHGTNHAKDALMLVRKFCKKHDLPLTVKKIEGTPPKGASLEMWWRDQRYDFLHSLDTPVITVHNLNDVAEWWIFTSLRGNPKLTPYRNKNVFRPFLLTKKSTLELWCERNCVPFVTDPSNSGDRFSRSLIRKNIVPEALRVHPGFLTTMSNKIKKTYAENQF